MTEPSNDGGRVNPKKDAPIGKIMATVAVGFAALVAIVVARVLLSGESPHPDPYDEPPVNTASPTSECTLPGEVTIDPSLPDALPLPDGIWDQVEPGWVLVDYMPVIVGQTSHPPRPILEHTKHVVYLMSPEGSRYQVAEFSPDFLFSITSWTAGETVAYISVCDDPVECSWKPTRVLDLTTCTVSAADSPWGGSSDVQYISTLPDGTRLWAKQGIGGAYLETGGQENRSWTEIDDRWVAGNPVKASPDGNYLALGTSGELSPGQTEDGDTSEVLIMSLTSQEETRTPMLGGDWRCYPLTWLGPTRLATRCGSVDEMREVDYVYDLATGELTPGAAGYYPGDNMPRDGSVGPLVRRDVQLGYDQYAGDYFDPSSVEDRPLGTPYPLGIDDHGVLTSVTLLGQSGDPLGHFSIEDHVGPLLYILAESNGTYRTDRTVIVYDMDTGSQRVLIGPPLAGPTFGKEPGVDDVAWVLAVLSWAVAH